MLRNRREFTIIRRFISRSKVFPETIFKRSFRLKQTHRTCWTIHSDEHNLARRRTFHELNSLGPVQTPYFSCAEPNSCKFDCSWSDTGATSYSDGAPCVEPKLSSTKVRQTLSNFCRTKRFWHTLLKPPYQIDSDAALLPYLIHQLDSAHEWRGVWTEPKFGSSSGGVFLGILGGGGVAWFLKSWPDFRAKNLIFYTVFRLDL